MTDRDSTAEATVSRESSILSNTQLVEYSLGRGCYVEILNSCECSVLSNPQVYLYSGLCSLPLTLNIKPTSEGRATFYKTSGAATGAVGVFTYDLAYHPPKQDDDDDKLKLAVMFSVPFDRVSYGNRFAVGLFDSRTACNYDLYHLMYSGKDPRFVRGEGGGSAIKSTGECVAIEANMSDTCTAVLKVVVSDKTGEEGGSV